MRPRSLVGPLSLHRSDRTKLLVACHVSAGLLAFNTYLAFMGILTSNIPTEIIDTRDLWNSFSKEGNIAVIDILEDSAGTRDGKAKIRFSPPPARAFWQQDSYPIPITDGVCNVQVELEPQSRTFKTPSPVNPMKKYPEVMSLNAQSVDFGIMCGPNTMMNMFTAIPPPRKTFTFKQNMFHREIVIELELPITDPRPPQPNAKIGQHNRLETIRFSVPFRQLETIYLLKTDKSQVELLLTLDEPPRYFRKVGDLGTHEENGRYWNQNDAWYRQTDIVYDPKILRYAPIALRKLKPVIDIGRWTTYRFVLAVSPDDRQTFDQMCQALKDYNIRLLPFPKFELIRDREPAVWDFIDKPIRGRSGFVNSLHELIEEVVPPLKFPVRYQLEACISQGVLNEHNLTQEFVTQLMQMDDIKAQDILEYIANQKKRVYDPMKIFSMTAIKGSAWRNIPQYCMFIRSATVTPSTVYYNTPTVETSNRVVRQYVEHADRFLRVRFTDEKFQGRINSTHKSTMDEIFTRIKRTMNNGLKIGDRHYEFLAFGNSQFREHGAYFFAPLPHLNVHNIRQWMGLFKEIRIVAKYAARLGQCFSTTRAIKCTKVSVVEIADTIRKKDNKKYNFTDGVGKISPFLAQLAAGELGLTAPEAPSLFQFRLGGCKGVLTVWPDVKLREIHIRESQYKFPAKHEGLEIIRWSQMAAANLNRQIILVLSALGVPDQVFLRKLKLQLATLEQAMTEEKAALTLLQRDIDPNQMTLTLASMILDGFQKSKEPFFASLIHLWRAWSIKYLKEKARITISDGAFLLGCVDETSTLKGHYDSVIIDHSDSMEENEEKLPEVFVQLSKGPDSRPYVVKGPMLLARNPSLHPGDVRIVRGVDVPALRHLKDVVVLPMTGDRDISCMCSGGDLDGDDYMVIWDQDLLPTEWNHTPMDYTPPDPLTVDRDVTTNDITSFFVNYMKNDTLPTIAHAHIAQADYWNNGIKDDKCLRLAALHSMAVDYVKSGIPAVMGRELRPRKWPHFMEKIHKPKHEIYDSKKVIGQLYDQVERMDFVPAYDRPFDKRILTAYRLTSEIIQKAANLKIEYDAAILRIMAQHDIKTEFEVWSTFVLQHAMIMKDYKFHEEIGRLSQTLKDEFRAECYRKAGGKDFETIAPFVAAMYYVTNRQMQTALRECRQTVALAGVNTPLRKMEPASMPLMSFPWLFQSILGRIANGAFGAADEDLAPIQGDVKRSTTKQKVFSGDGDLLLETAEGVTHRGENLVLFEHGDGSDASSSDEHTPPSTSEPSSSLSSSISADLHSLANGETTPGFYGDASLSKISAAGSGSVSPKEVDMEYQRALSPNAARLDELFRNEEDDVGSLSNILTPPDSESASSKHEPASRRSRKFSVRPLIDIDVDETENAGVSEEIHSDDEEDGGIEVEVHLDGGHSFMDQLGRLLGE